MFHAGMPILGTEPWKIVIPEGDGSSCRSCGNIFLMDTPCDQRGLRRRGRLDEPQGDYLSMSHALGVTATAGGTYRSKGRTPVAAVLRVFEEKPS